MAASRRVVVAVTVRMPGLLHDVLGEYQTRLELAIVGIFGGGVTAVLLTTHRQVLVDVPMWRTAIAALLIADVAAGSAANLTRGTSRYYAVRPRNRLTFIAVHVHLLAIALLVGSPLGYAALVWAYTILTALVVNRLQRSELQTLVGGVALALGALIVVALTPRLGPMVAAVAALFVMKVTFAFAVDHYRDAQEEVR